MTTRTRLCAAALSLGGLLFTAQTWGEGPAKLEAKPGVLGGATIPPILLKDGSYVGEVRAFATEIEKSTPLTGWIECDGRELVADNHKQLLQVIGTRFGVATAGKFRIPDLRGRFLRGWSHGSGNDPGIGDRQVPDGGPAYPDGKDHIGTFQPDAFKQHPHKETGSVQDGGDVPGLVAPNATGTKDTNLETRAAGDPNETRPRNVAILFAIRDPDANKP